MLRAILFDSDGVLVDTERLFFDATRTAFESAGASLSCQQWAKWYLGEGKRSREIARLIGIPLASVEATIAKRDALFWRQVDHGAPVFPGVKTTLTHLARHFRLAVVTGACRRHYERVHSSTGLAGFFEFVVTCEKDEEAKPNPQTYLTALEKLSVPAGECLAVEDSPRGAAAAVSAGIRCFIAPTHLTDVALCPAGCNILRDLTCLAKLTPTSGFDS